jgi:hypothetical protein
MKYLKRFNEELKPSTYFSASRKLAKIGHWDRSKDLKDWGLEMESREEMDKWRKNIEKYSPFGVFKMTIKNDDGETITGDFYLDINFDDMAFLDEPENGITFFLGLIPTSEELINKYKELCQDFDFGNGFFWGKIFHIEYNIVDQKVELTKWDFDDYDSDMNGKITFADRASANKFKNLLIKMTTDSDLRYPSGYTDHVEVWDKLTASILGEASFASDYGFELEDIAKYIRTISPNLLYTTI